MDIVSKEFECTNVPQFNGKNGIWYNWLLETKILILSSYSQTLFSSLERNLNFIKLREICFSTTIYK